jgi:molybdopterin synthase sulfur carrier subunit
MPVPPARRHGHRWTTTMNVDLAMFAYLADYQPDGAGGRHARTLDLPDNATVAELVRRLELPNEPRIVFVNGRHAPESRALKQGDRLAIFPPVAGG